MRSRVVIVQVRATDLQSGDVVNRRGPERDGWTVIDRVEPLHGGAFVVHDVTDNDSFTAKPYDLVWIQMLETMTEDSDIAVPAAVPAAISDATPDAITEAVPAAITEAVPDTTPAVH